MKKLLCAILASLLITFFVSGTIYAANHYILDGGAGDGSAWNNALDQVPATLVRGDTYYIGVGNYTGFVIDDAVSGADIITIKKATVADHGTETGWDAGYAGQAVFQNATGDTAAHKSTIQITVSYVTIDGIVGSGTDKTTYGFKVLPPADFGENSNSASGIYGIFLYQLAGLSNVIVKHVALDGPGQNNCLKLQAESGLAFNCCNDGLSVKANMDTRSSSIELANNYSEGWVNNINVYGVTSSTVHDNIFDTNASDTYCHGQNMNIEGSEDLDIYNNVFHDSNIYMIAVHNNNPSSTPVVNLRVWNNIFDGMQGAFLTNGIGGMTGTTADSLRNAYIAQNTFVNATFNQGAVWAGKLADTDNHSHVYNNIFYNCVSPRLDNVPSSGTVGAIVHDYNAYLKCTGTYSNADESAPQVDASASDPFTNSGTGDYTLKTGTLPIDHGTALAAAYNKDKAGTTRPVNTVWDIGAYEFTGTPVYTVTPSGTNCTVSPNTGVSVETGQTTIVTMTGDYGYSVSGGGTCGGALVGSSYTTSAITGACTVTCAGLGHRAVIGSGGTVTLGGSGVTTLGN